MQQPFFSDKKILLVDSSFEKTNDRTWCFWEKEKGLFENIVHHSWQQLNFYSSHFSSALNIAPYRYKMIRSLDFYQHIISEAKQKSNIEFLEAKVEASGNENNFAFIIAAEKKYSAQYIFNSVLSPPEKGYGGLLQHFKGWLIETAENIFDEQSATFMDFRVSQNDGTAFVYVLPVAVNKALVEYTFFTEQLLPAEAYNELLKNYIEQYLPHTAYTIQHEEFGVIPMTDYNFEKCNGNIISIGTAGGQTKGSSGFTFQFIQKHSDAIVNALMKNQSPCLLKTWAQKRFHLYDSVLLDVLIQKKMGGDEIFAQLFKKNPAQKILKFLDNQTSFAEDLAIMNSVPKKIFFPMAMKEIFKRL